MSDLEDDAVNWQPSVIAFDYVAAVIGAGNAAKALVECLATGVVRAKASKLTATLYDRYDASQAVLNYRNKNDARIEMQFFIDMMAENDIFQGGRANLEAGSFEALRPDHERDNRLWASGPHGFYWEVRATGVVICMSEVVAKFAAPKSKAGLLSPASTPAFNGTMYEWIVEMVAHKKPKGWIERNYRDVFPDTRLSRQQVRESYNRIKIPRMGRPVDQ